MEKVNFISFADGMNTISIRISKIDMVKVEYNNIKYTTEEITDDNMFYTPEKTLVTHEEWEKLLSKTGELFDITFYAPSVEPKKIKKQYLVGETASIIKKIISSGEAISKELEKEIENNQYLQYENETVFINSILDPWE